MKTILINLLMIAATVTVFGQDQKIIDSVSINFSFPYVTILDSSQLTLKVAYKNNTNRLVEMYQYLDEGYVNDRFFNISIEVEKLKQNKYLPNPVRFYQGAFTYSMVDSLRHFDLPKKKLAPFASDTLVIKPFNSCPRFSSG